METHYYYALFYEYKSRLEDLRMTFAAKMLF